MFIGIDLGTSSVKTLLVDEQQNIVATASYELSVERPHPAWSEQDPSSWIEGIKSTFAQLRNGHADALSQVQAIGLSGQQHGATLLNSAGNPLRPCILWNDSRSQSEAAELDTSRSRDLTGNILFPGFTAPKLAWVAKHEPEVFAQVAKVLLPKDYARYWLTGDYVGDQSDSAGTGWLDVANRQWSTELLNACQLDESHMPRLVEGSEKSGTVKSDIASLLGIPASTVVAGGAGDNAASACGMGNVSPGDAFLSLGTSGVLFASNESYRPNAASAVHTFCHAVPNTWHQMGVILSAADSLTWLSNLTGQSAQALTQALKPESASAVRELFLPYLGGERTPHNDANIRGTFLGLSHSSDSAQMTRAVLQGVAFAFKDSQVALASAGTELTSAYAIGGGSRSEYWVQLLANVLNIPLHLTDAGDVGAGFGAARLARLSVTEESVDSVCTPPPIAKTIVPVASTHDGLNEQYEKFKVGYTATQAF
jgi:xylulokinase